MVFADLRAMASSEKGSLPPLHYRFVVKSAEEAVKLIREQLGDKAHVVSVNQINGKGLARFLKAPQLEVIATVTPVPEAKPAAPAVAKALENPDPLSSGLAGPEALAKIYARRESLVQAQYQATEQEPLSVFLKKSGFSERLIYHFRRKSSPSRTSNTEANELMDMVQFLIQQYQGLKQAPMTDRIAFLGSSGVGKSTLLCKQLARDVFIQKSSPSVLKLDHTLPHSNEALRVFCKALGVNCLKAIASPYDLPGPLYIDMSGPSLKDTESWAVIDSKLKQLGVQTRVWVLQAAYEEELLLENLHVAERLGATHLAFTHLDEVHRLNKLWDSLLLSGLSPGLCSYGQGVSGEATTDILQLLLARAFPSKVLEGIEAIT